jgi:predicted transcriptional regulator
MTKVRTTTIGTGSEAEFFERGRNIAALADAGLPLPVEKRVTFGEFSELAQLLTPARKELVDAVRAQEGSIQELANRLHRDRSKVSRDVAVLASKGVFIVKDEVLPGHGRMKRVSTPPGKVRFVTTI